MMRRFLLTSAAILAAVGMGSGSLLFAASGAHAARFSKIVDNSSKHFRAPDWGRSAYSKDRYGKNYRYARPSRDKASAKFRAKLPARAKYAVYMRWPARSGYNKTTNVGVRSVSGYKWEQVNQRRNSGKWVKLGVYKMKSKWGTKVKVSRRSKSRGYVIADAVKFVRTASDGDGSGGVNGYDVVREAKTWLGTPYRYGGTSRDGVDCSGLTLRVYGSLGIKLPRTASDQYYNGPGTKVSHRGRGYLVFGHADGGKGIEHVGILTGDGHMIHAPYPGTVVRYDKLPNGWYNVVGVKRIVPAK